ncbi:Hypothetical protein EIN_527210, partial [Entamoeba invadens IP1]
MIPPNMKVTDLHNIFYDNGEKVNQLYAITEANINVNKFYDADFSALTCLTKFTLKGGKCSVKLPTSLVELTLYGSSKAVNVNDLKQLKKLNGNNFDNNNPANTPCQAVDENEENEEQNDEGRTRTNRLTTQLV